MVYLIALAAIFLGIYLYDYKKYDRGNFVFWILLCVYFICIAGLRYRLGGDTAVYMHDFEAIHPISSISWKEITASRYAPGFNILVSTFKEIYPNYFLFQFVDALILNTVVFYFFYKNCSHKYLAILVYFVYVYFSLSLDLMREAIAVAIFLLAWPAFKNGKWIWWYVATCCAMLFHVSATIMIFLPLICLPGINQLFVFGKRTIVICLIIFFIGVIIQKNFYNYIQLLSISEGINERAEVYGKSYLGNYQLNINGFIANAISYILYPLFFLILYSKKRNKEEPFKFDKFIAFVILSLYVIMIALKVSILIRFNNYFFFFVIAYISNCAFTPFFIQNKRVRLDFITWIFVFVSMLTFYVYKTYYNPFHKEIEYNSYRRYYPYNSIIDGKRDEEREKTIRYLRKKMD
ncbi:MAG: EpsG family protein [Muribaculaceae bacterium]|nr:EpsG family protein [Muribaculaceae bacterium]